MLELLEKQERLTAAIVEAIEPAFLFLASCYALAALAFWIPGIETKRRTIEEIDFALSGGKPAPAEPRTA